MKHNRNRGSELIISELIEIIDNAPWFSKIKPINEVLNTVECWEWLPTSRDQVDPIHGNRMKVRATELIGDSERRKIEMSVVQAAIKAMQNSPANLAALISGPDNYIESAKAAAVFATRMASREIILSEPGFWCNVIHEYSKGFWPCGVNEKGELIVL
jgi:hypothetical protein